jgi:transmembrane sensor
MDKHELRELSQKYLNGTATPAEKQRLDQWYDDAHSGMPETVTVATADTEEAIQQRVFNNLHNNLFARQAPVQSSHGVIKRLAIWSGSVAAVLALLIFAWGRYSNDAVPAIAVTTTHELVMAPKNRVHLTMPDGSKVVLNAGAIFRYPKKFGTKTREVELVAGRAFFDIKHQDGHPFIVKTKTLNVTVLGTSFDVNSNVTNGTTCVSVLTGKVGITRTNQKGTEVLMLLPSQQVLVGAQTRLMKKEAVLQAPVKTWYKDDFVFEQESLGSVFKMLEKEYNTHITIENKKLLDERVTVKLNNLQPLDTIMQTLSYTKHFNYQMANDSTVIIK